MDDRARAVADLRLLNDTVAATPFSGKYRMFGGALLGWAREGALLGHDLHDFDFAFECQELPVFRAAVPALVAAGFEPLNVLRNNRGVPTEYTFKKGAARFEFFAFQSCDDYWFSYSYYASRWPPKRVENLVRTSFSEVESFEFLDRSWLKAADHEKELAELYGDWRVPDPAYRYEESLAIVRRKLWRRPVQDWDGTVSAEAPVLEPNLERYVS